MENTKIFARREFVFRLRCRCRLRLCFSFRNRRCSSTRSGYPPQHQRKYHDRPQQTQHTIERKRADIFHAGPLGYESELPYDRCDGKRGTAVPLGREIAFESESSS